ncbi:PilN domain-containing protein [Vibrio sp. MACH09]|uniref:PilN domain-containing protein n=1 Tax=Vibrio sp. MACH09 TaxID=3025122 RepID=UPI00295E328B|nr:PilN domain-containing protein [Vibrio sp. MACH09]
MSLTDIISKLRSPSSVDHRLHIMIQQDAIYLSDTADLNAEPLRFPIEKQWEETIDAVLASNNFSGCHATVTFSSSYYQIYQIDKPELPIEEWPSALPFLLKDLISERVTDIIADATLLPDGRKVQAYVINKKQILTLNSKLDKQKVMLHRVVPEEILWGHAQHDIAHFMLLRRSIKSDFKIGAYANGDNRFQRSIRGVVAPLTGNASSELQFDSIALELQRSIDYLSAQLRDTPLNHLLICCDEESSEELLSALSSRLSVKVLLFSQYEQWLCGQILCQAIKELPQQGINLYPSFLKPKVELLCLKNVTLSWVVLAAVMLSSYGYFDYQNRQSKQQLDVLMNKNSQLAEELELNQAKLLEHTPSAEKLVAAERWLANIDNQKARISAIEEFDDALTVGYSGVMQALAQLARDDISLSAIKVNNKQLNFKGETKSPENVPSWVKSFKHELNLKEKTFDTLSIVRDEDNVVTFELSTQVDLSNSSEPSTQTGLSEVQAVTPTTVESVIGEQVK